MNEVWKDIDGYNGYYKVSNLGRIKNSKGRILRQHKQNSGYLMIHLCNKNNSVGATIHSLVANAFVPNPDKKPQINHIDGKKENNTSENLQWVTAKENVNHAVKNGLLIPYVRTDDHRKKRSEWCSKKFKGIKKTSEHNKKNSEAHKGKNPSCNVNRTRRDFVKVICVDNGIIFPCMKDAADYIGCKKDKMWRHLRFGTKYDFITKKFKIIKEGSKQGGKSPNPEDLQWEAFKNEYEKYI